MGDSCPTSTPVSYLSGYRVMAGEGDIIYVCQACSDNSLELTDLK